MVIVVWNLVFRSWRGESFRSCGFYLFIELLNGCGGRSFLGVRKEYGNYSIFRFVFGDLSLIG